MTSFKTLEYHRGSLRLLDQTQLPGREVYVDLQDLESIAQAIETMVVRGAPAIGVAAAFGLAIAVQKGVAPEVADARLRRTRPTAVNLFWALDRMAQFWRKGADAKALEDLALQIDADDKTACQRIGEFGAELIPDGARILTHCNAGALATAGEGTALAVISAAHRQGKKIKVYADETRPVLQGARLTAWELMRDGIDVTLIVDSAVAHLLSLGEIDCAVVGADRIAANGDVANKIGTRMVSCLLFHHQKPVYVAAPWSTVDMNCPSGQKIEIEERSADEIRQFFGTPSAPTGIKIRNPAFDVSPAEWLAGIITNRGYTGKDIAPGLRRLATMPDDAR